MWHIGQIFKPRHDKIILLQKAFFGLPLASNHGAIKHCL